MSKAVPVYEVLAVFCDLYTKADMRLRKEYSIPRHLSVNEVTAIFENQAYSESVLFYVLRNYADLCGEHHLKYCTEESLKDFALEELLSVVIDQQNILITEDEKRFALELKNQKAVSNQPEDDDDLRRAILKDKID